MNPIPQPSEAKPDLARKLRETCAHFTEAADESFFFRQLYLLIASIFGKIEDIFLLWKAGNLPPPPVRQPRQSTHAPTPSSPRHKSARRTARRTRASTARPIRVRRTGAWTTSTTPPPKQDAPVRRIDRYPKNRPNPPLSTQQRLTSFSLRYHN